MKPLKLDSGWVAGSLYFLILLAIALWVRDIPYQQEASNTIQQLIKSSTMGDPGSFATAAIDIAGNGWISSANAWIFNLWPPGFVLLEAFIIKTLGPDTPIILVLQILAALLFALVLTLLADFLSTYVPRKIALALPLLIFAFPVSRVFLLEPTGITLGESFAIGFFLVGVLLALRAIAQNSLRSAVYAGLCLALSAYFRSQFEIILLALTGWGILLLLAIQLPRLRKSIEPQSLKAGVRTIAVVLLVAHAATLPWRVYHWINQGSPTWVYTSSAVIFPNSVQTSEYLESVHGGFVVAGGGNLVCRIDPTTCGDTANAKNLFIKTFVEHPIKWYSLKSAVIGKYWFSSLQNWSAIGTNSTFMDLATNGLLLIALLVTVSLLLTRKVRSHGSWMLLIWVNASMISAYLLIFTLAHFEVRYFYFPKIATIVMTIISVGLYCRPLKAQTQRDNCQDVGSYSI
jgi:hypothetical protein